MVEIPTIEPFQFIRSTAFSERVQLANKLNEVIDALNKVGSVDDLQTQIDAINSEISEIQTSIGNTDTSLAELENQVNTLISEVNSTIKQSISALESEVDGIDTRLTTAEGTISEHGTEIDGLLKEVVDGVVMTSSPHGTVQVQINHEDGSNDISAPIDLGLVEEGGIVLQSGTTDRSFKLIVTLTDGTSWQTNDFVIPEGGGTEVSVTNISIAQGTGDDKIQVKIGLSDGSTISSNDWTVVTPSEFSALGTRVTTAEGKITKNTGDISDLDSRVQALEDSPGYALQPATATALGGVKIGAGIIVQGDGTISIDKTQINSAAVASTVEFTVDASKVTFHADSVGGSEFAKDIPQASQGGAGTIDAAAYQKLQSIPAPDTIATDADVQSVKTDLQGQITAISPTVSVNEEVDPPTITVNVNGKSSTANLPVGGGSEWEKLDLSNLPTDFAEGDIVIIHSNVTTRGTSSGWSTGVTDSKINFTPGSNDSFTALVLRSTAYVASNTGSLYMSGSYISFTAINNVNSLSDWNNISSNPTIFTYTGFCFNGARPSVQSSTVNRTNIQNKVTAMYRLKK